jgi:hypothetical protein
LQLEEAQKETKLFITDLIERNGREVKHQMGKEEKIRIGLSCESDAMHGSQKIEFVPYCNIFKL